MKNKKRNLRQILFYFSLFGTYSVSFRLCNALSVYLLSFLAVFCFGKYFLRGSFSYIQSGEDADTACVFDGFLVTSFSCKGCGARKMKQKEHGFVVMESQPSESFDMKAKFLLNRPVYRVNFPW